MLIDTKWVFRTSGGSEDLATSGTTPVLSDYIDLKAVSGYGDGGGAMFATVRVKTTTAAAGASFAVSIADCDTSGGTYVARSEKVVPLADVVANTVIAHLPFPQGCRQFIKLSVVPAASMTGALTVNGAITTE